MSLFYDPPMKIHKAHHEERGPDSHYYQGQYPVPFMFVNVDAESNHGLPGACFELCMEEQMIARGISDFNGAVYFPSLYPGTYTLSEVSAPEGYENREHTYHVIVDKQGGISVDGTPMRSFRVECSKVPEIFGEFTVIKYDVCTGQRLSGAQFELFISSQPAAHGITDKEGQLAFSRLRPGLYTLVETQPPAGYTRSKETYSIEVRKDGKVIIDGYPRSSILIENEPVVHFLCFKTIDAQTQQPVAGAKFALLSEGIAALEAVSDRFGRVLFENLPAGSYAIQEQTPPPGYLPDGKTYATEIHSDGKAVIGGYPCERFAVCYYRQYSFKIVRTDENRVPLAGALFELQQNGKTVQKTATGPDGSTKVSLPAPGFYTIKETTSPAGRPADKASHTVNMNTDGTILIDGRQTDILTVSTRAAGLQVSKVNPNDEPLMGAVFELRSGSTVLQSVGTGADGIAVFNIPAAGSYTLVETQPPQGYRAEPTAYAVTIGQDGAAIIGAEQTTVLTVQNLPVLYEVSFITKAAQTGEPLAGAEFELLSEGRVITSAIAGTDGRVNFGGFPLGEYSIRQSAPADGCKAEDSMLPVSVQADGAVTIAGEPARAYVFESNQNTEN